MPRSGCIFPRCSPVWLRFPPAHPGPIALPLGAPWPNRPLSSYFCTSVWLYFPPVQPGLTAFAFCAPRSACILSWHTLAWLHFPFVHPHLGAFTFHTSQSERVFLLRVRIWVRFPSVLPVPLGYFPFIFTSFPFPSLPFSTQVYVSMSTSISKC